MRFEIGQDVSIFYRHEIRDVIYHILHLISQIPFYLIGFSFKYFSHSQAEDIISSIPNSAFQPSSFVDLVTSPQTFTISPSRRGPTSKLSCCPDAFSNALMASNTE